MPLFHETKFIESRFLPRWKHSSFLQSELTAPWFRFIVMFETTRNLPESEIYGPDRAA